MIRISSDKDKALYATLAGKFTALGAEASFRMFVPGFMLSRFNRIVNLFVLDYD